MSGKELEGVELDSAVARALGKRYVAISPDRSHCWAGANHQDQDGGLFAPSTNWNHGGPIIEHNGIELWQWKGDDGTYWCAHVGGQREGDKLSIGATPLIAAMRAFVRSKSNTNVTGALPNGAEQE